jgi:7-cyano-7-deazaguanine synthase in queuosine biosynthesis
MKITCALEDYNFDGAESDLNVVLYGRARNMLHGSAGAALKSEIARQKLVPASKAWDILSIALSIMSADLAGHRSQSPDGWTRQFELTISVIDAPFWNTQAPLLQTLFGFLSTDSWRFTFIEGGFMPIPDLTKAEYPDEECIVLLSGGLDSLIGAVDLNANGMRPLAVSQMVRGDGEKQDQFASTIGNGLRHFQANHNIDVPDQENPPSQRTRSIIFLAYGILMATTLSKYHLGEEITLYVCENGFIAINPPLTGGRIGSLSTRTTHPMVFGLMQRILANAGLNVRIENPYQLKTKGEMLVECRDQAYISAHAHESTSCGRYKQFGYKHCGRCVPCLVRRAAFNKWGIQDQTVYVYNDLSIDDEEHARFDDIRSALMGIEERRQLGTGRWLRSALSSGYVQNKPALIDTVERGLAELEALFHVLHVS